MTATAIGINNYLNDKTFRFSKSSNAEQTALNIIFNESSENERKYHELVRNLNHEIKTPLASLRLVAEGIEDGVFAPDEKACKEIVDNVKRLDATLAAVKQYVEYQSQYSNANNMSMDAIECDMIEANHDDKSSYIYPQACQYDKNIFLNQSTCEPFHVIDSAVSLFEQEFLPIGIIIDYNKLNNNEVKAFCKENNIDNLNVRLADSDLRASLNQVLENVKQHAHGAKRCVITEQLLTGHDGICYLGITISDDGCGCNADQKTIMSPLWKGDASHTACTKNKNDDSGCGMGLACTRSAVLSAGGSISIESSAGNGFSVKITMPITCW